MSLDKQLYNFARRGVMPLQQGGVGSGPLSLDSTGKPIRTGVGREFFVAGNWGADTNDGSSWDKAFLTLAAAITANNADISADKYGWATRNRIYLSADSTNEDLVAFPNKCDVIGCGSCDAFHMASIKGNHVPVNAQNWGTTFHNIRFVTEAAGIIITLASTSSGVMLDNCLVDATGESATATVGIQSTASTYLRLYNTRFQGAFSTGYILFGAGAALGCELIGNIMTDSAGYGITLDASCTMAYLGIMANNIIQCAGCTLDDQQNKFILTGNKFISAASTGDNSFHFHVSVRAADNWVSDATKSGPFPVLDTT